MRWQNLERQCAVLAPVDCPLGTVAVLDAAYLATAAHRRFAPGSVLAWTSPSADVQCGLPVHQHRQSVIVLDFDAIARSCEVHGMSPPAKLHGTLIHELAHVLTYPDPRTLPLVSPASSAAVGQFVRRAAERPGALGGDGNPGLPGTSTHRDPLHGPDFGRVLCHLLWRADQMGVPHQGAWLGKPSMSAMRATLEGSFELLGAEGRSLRTLAKDPMPPMFQLLFPE